MHTTKNSKLLMIHADDAGLSHAHNMATIEALEFGLVNSYSIMVPCPWFYEIAQFAKKNPSYDYGIHLTLTCEWENYKFGPISPVQEVPSLVDENGFFYKKRESLRIHATVEEIAKELEAQVELALKFGLQPTHLDSHMYSVGSHSEFFIAYKSIGEKYNLPVLINKQLMKMVGLNTNKNLMPEDFIVENTYVANFDHFKGKGLADYYNTVIDHITPGLHMLLIHPAFNTSEMQGITVNHPNFGAVWRQADFDYFTSERAKSKLKENNIKLIDWREIQNYLKESR